MTPHSRRKPDPDRILCAKLSGTALRLAHAGGPISDAVAELRELASGRDDAREHGPRKRRHAPEPLGKVRADLLALEAGLMGGSWSARPNGDEGSTVVAVGLLIMAGADLDLIPAAFELGRERGSAVTNVRRS